MRRSAAAASGTLASRRALAKVMLMRPDVKIAIAPRVCRNFVRSARICRGDGETWRIRPELMANRAASASARYELTLIWRRARRHVTAFFLPTEDLPCA
jgi:hypothetical protein